MTKTKVESGMTSPKPAPPAGPHISQAVREALKEQDPEIARHVRSVADSK
jgi:hypothetical protein